MSTPKQKKDDFEALFKKIFKRKIYTVKIATAWMQPLQYDLRCSAAKDNSVTHAAAAPSNVEHTRCRAPASSPKHSPWQHSCSHYNAIIMRSATTASGNAQNYTTGATTCCKTHRRNQSRPERPQPHPSHTRGTFHRRLQPLYTEKHTVSCSGFLPKP